MRSAQATVLPLETVVYTLEGVVSISVAGIHNPKVGGSIPPPATISSIDSKSYVDNSLLPGLVDLNDASFIYSAHVRRKPVSETVGPKLPRLEIRRAYIRTGKW